MSTGSPVGYEYETPRTSTSAGLGGGVVVVVRIGRDVGGEHAVEPLGGDDRARHLLEQEPDDPHREREEGEQRHRLHDVARRDHAFGDPPAADGEDRDDPEVRQRVERGLEERAEPADLDALLAELVGRDRQPVDLVVLEAERLHHERAVEALVRDPGDLAHVRLHGGGGPLDAAGVVAVEQRHQREEDEPDQGQDRVDDEERDDREDDEDDEPGGEGQRVDDLGGREDVGVGVGEQLAGRRAAVEVERHREEVVGDRVAQPGLPEPGGLAREVAAQ